MIWSCFTASASTGLSDLFLLVRPILNTKMKKTSWPTRTSFSRNFQCKKAPRWLSKFFHFSTKNRADQLKNHPVEFGIQTLDVQVQVPDISVSCSLTWSTSTAINYSYMDNTQTNNFKLTDLHLSHKQASSKATIWDDDDVICGGYVAAEVGEFLRKVWDTKYAIIQYMISLPSVDGRALLRIKQASILV